MGTLLLTKLSVFVLLLADEAEGMCFSVPMNAFVQLC